MAKKRRRWHLRILALGTVGLALIAAYVMPYLLLEATDPYDATLDWVIRRRCPSVRVAKLYMPLARFEAKVSGWSVELYVRDGTKRTSIAVVNRRPGARPLPRLPAQ